MFSRYIVISALCCSLTVSVSLSTPASAGEGTLTMIGGVLALGLGLGTVILGSKIGSDISLNKRGLSRQNLDLLLNEKREAVLK